MAAEPPLPAPCTPNQLRAVVVGPLDGAYQVNLINMSEHEACSLVGYPKAVLAVSGSGVAQTVKPKLYPAGQPKPVILRERSVTAATPVAAITLRGAQLRLDIYFDCTHLKQGEHGTSYSSLKLVLPTGTVTVPYDTHASSAQPWKIATYCGAWTMHTFEPPVPFTWEAPAV
ncbi:MAG TPA: hypothetical protein VGP33_15045 [Chloroflexota bacterium]|nr:hypothetical protein [Chloroflexota bacterium]